MQFDVRVVAFDPNSTEDPVEALVRVFRVEPAIARELVNRLPRVIKRGVTIETAQKFCDVLARMGATTEIVMSTPKEPAPGGREPRSRGLPGGRGPGAPAPGAAALAPVVGQPPANGNAFAQADRATGAFPQSPSTVFRNSDSSVFLLPEPLTSDTMRLPPRAALPHPFAPRTAPLEEVRARHGLPAPREPDPLEADIHAFVDRAFAEVPSSPPARGGRPSRRPTLAQEPEEVRVTYNALPNLAAAEAARLAAEPAPEPPWLAPAEPAPTASRAKRRSFRPARPVPEFEPPTPAARPAVLPEEQGPLFRDLPKLDAPPAAPLPREVVREAPPVAREAPPVAREAPLPVPREAPLPVAREASLHPPEPAPSRESVAMLPVPGVPFTMPALSTAGPQADKKQAVLRGSRAVLRSVQTVSWLMFAALTLITVGVAPLVVLGAWLRDAHRRRLRVRAMQGSAVPVGQAQLPELYGWAKQLGMRLDLATTPRLYLGRRVGSDLVSVPFHGELHVLVDSDAFVRHAREGSMHVLTFQLAHELSRFALGHTGRLRAALAALWPTLGRSDALCADALAAQLMGDRQLAQRALLALLAGSALAELLDFGELERQGASLERHAATHAPALDAGTGFLLARLYHLQHGYQKTAVRDSVQEP